MPCRDPESAAVRCTTTVSRPGVTVAMAVVPMKASRFSGFMGSQNCWKAARVERQVADTNEHTTVSPQQLLRAAARRESNSANFTTLNAIRADHSSPSHSSAEKGIEG